MNTLDITLKNFDTKLNGIVKRATTLRHDIQCFIVFGLLHYETHGDTTYLTKLLTAMSNVKTVPAKTIQIYIMSHANVYWTKDKKTGVKSFKKKVKGEAATVTMPDVVWYEHEVNKSNDDKPDFKLDAYMLRVVKHLSKNGVDPELITAIGNAASVTPSEMKKVLDSKAA